MRGGGSGKAGAVLVPCFVIGKGAAAAIDQCPVTVVDKEAGVRTRRVAARAAMARTAAGRQIILVN